MSTRNRHLIEALICWLIMIICLFLMGCGRYQKWDTPTKVMFTGLVAGQALDAAITSEILVDGGEEYNPVFDGHEERTIPLKIIGLTACYFITDWIEPEYRKWFLIPANILTWGVVVHNYGELQ